MRSPFVVKLRPPNRSGQAGYFLLVFSFSFPLSERNRVTVVPHSGQAPLAIGRPFAVSVTVPFSIVRFLRHLTQ